ncbi:MAG: NAD(P)-dependent alcohol dehydrogenase [Gemmatimonadetes bacterium]|nr:NAD(P)-dependent alcohol dehydrogenase [Gemmatimonadota bacterium]MYD26181.1 NAD(P)-dependent alcohol dehydrogenase [Gemmatimonadota bacterium]
MRAYVIDHNQLRLADLAEPEEPGPGEVLVRVRSVSLNYRDLMVARGRYGKPFEGWFVAGSDMAGDVLKTGPGVSTIRSGDRVVNAPFLRWPAGRLTPDGMKTLVGAGGVDGVLCEQVVYPADALVAMPSHFSYHEGATLPIAGLTAWASVVSQGRLQAGEWVLLHGTGGVSVFAAQLSELTGAQALLTTSSEEKARRMKEEFGVLETFDYRDEGWPDQVRIFTGGGGVDLIVDVAGGQTFAKSLKACALHARISLVGILDGFETRLNPFDIIGRQIQIRGIYTSSTEDLRDLSRACEASGLRPCIDRVFSFDEVPAAYDYLESQRHIGKIVCDLP